MSRWRIMKVFADSYKCSKGMAGTPGLEPAASAMTVSGLQVLSTTWKSTDGTASHWKYSIGNVIVHREGFVSHARLASNLRFAHNPSKIDAKRTHHFLP